MSGSRISGTLMISYANFEGKYISTYEGVLSPHLDHKTRLITLTHLGSDDIFNNLFSCHIDTKEGTFYP